MAFDNFVCIRVKVTMALWHFPGWQLCKTQGLEWVNAAWSAFVQVLINQLIYHLLYKIREEERHQEASTTMLLSEAVQFSTASSQHETKKVAKAPLHPLLPTVLRWALKTNAENEAMWQRTVPAAVFYPDHCQPSKTKWEKCCRGMDRSYFWRSASTWVI